MHKPLLLAAVFAVCFALALGAASEQELQSHFVQWMRQHNKAYSADEFQVRWTHWRNNAKFIEEFNARNVGFSVAMNKFGDLSNAEFNALYKGLRHVERAVPTVVNPEPLNPEAPSSWDWRQKGVVTHVKNQGQCGSCWSFSTTGSVEGNHAINTGTLVSLSEQNLVDCSGSYGNQGCNGGLMDDAFQYIIGNGGIDTESSYPYTAEDGYCNYQSSNCGSTLSSYQDLPSGDENSLLNAAYSQGPISVAIDASHDSFQFYSGGVYYEPACSSSQLDHGVLVVGYGTDSGSDYWLVKNSWGPDWGLNGYIEMARNRGNNCGIATAASYPTGAGNC